MSRSENSPVYSVAHKQVYVNEEQILFARA